VGDETLSLIATKLRESGHQLRNGASVRSEDYEEVWFVSAELVESGRDPGLNGDILTWVATSMDPAPQAYASAERQARRWSAWPPVEDDIDLQDDGGVESRSCVAAVRPQ
jgi:hypothetical protein